MNKGQDPLVVTICWEEMLGKGTTSMVYRARMGCQVTVAQIFERKYVFCPSCEVFRFTKGTSLSPGNETIFLAEWCFRKAYESPNTDGRSCPKGLTMYAPGVQNEACPPDAASMPIWCRIRTQCDAGIIVSYPSGVASVLAQTTEPLMHGWLIDVPPVRNFLNSWGEVSAEIMKGTCQIIIRPSHGRVRGLACLLSDSRMELIEELSISRVRNKPMPLSVNKGTKRKLSSVADHERV